MTNEEAIMWLNETKKYYGEYHECADEALDIAIKALEQNRPKGAWKEHDTTFGRNIYYCTSCGRSIEILYKYDFCPLCGADMRVEEDEI